ncbi:hypothetical protein B566_EDAN006448 [Ephemera danica]|nr:hypothetical protein B566_EDAN006448 [Ephemera danica]
MLSIKKFTVWKNKKFCIIIDIQCEADQTKRIPLASEEDYPEVCNSWQCIDAETVCKPCVAHGDNSVSSIHLKRSRLSPLSLASMGVKNADVETTEQEPDTASQHVENYNVAARYLAVFAAFLANVVCYIMRVNLSVAIVAIALKKDNVTLSGEDEIIDDSEIPGGLLPCSHALLARWAPPTERGRMSVYTYSGQPLGTVVALSGSGMLASSSAGWPMVFYVSGALGLATAVLWLWLVADSPAQHRLASAEECQYIESSIGGAKRDSSQHLETPWREILCSRPFWALLIAHSVQNWGFWTLLTQIPSYMSGVLDFHLKENGFLSALPYMAMWIFGLMLSCISDWMLSRKCYSVGTSRKIGNSLGHYGSAIALIVLGYVSADATVAVAILTLAVACNAGTMIGYQVNHIDLSPNFAGTMMGITNCVGNIMSILGPLLVGVVVTENIRQLVLIPPAKWIPINCDPNFFPSSAPEQDWWLQARYLVAFACFMANAVSFLMRVNLSVAIVAMTLENEGEGLHNNKNHSSPIYNWDSRTRGMVLSSFTWGYIVTQLPLGALAEQAGPRRPLFVCLVVSSAATFLFETAAAYGQQFGMIVGLSGSGILTAWAGWKYVFYTSGALGLVVAGLWFSLVTDSPDTHILASARERSHIQTSILAANGETKGGKHLSTPYKSIITSKHVWAIVIAHCAFMWSQWTLLTTVPSFLNGVAKFNMSQNGLLSALPFLVMWIVGLVLSWVSDWMLKRNCCSVTTSRKLGNSLAQYGSALGLIALGFFSEDPFTAVAILTTTVGVSAAVYIGFMARISHRGDKRVTFKMPSCCQRRGIVDVADRFQSKDSLIQDKGSWLQARYLIAFSCFLANTVFYIMRVNLSVAIVAMTYDENGDPPSGPEDVPLYDWDPSTRSTILSSFFWGYIITQIPAGYLANKYGPKIPFLVSILLSSIFTVLYVPAANLGWGWACASRVLLGLAQGGLLPCCHTLLAVWSLPGERGRMTVYSYTGQQFGTIVAMSGSGVLSASLGWPSVFYVTGGFGVLLAVLWMALVANTPETHRLASPRERRLIVTSIAAANGDQQHDSQENGFLSALPYLAMWITGILLSWISDWMLKRECYSVGTSRKIGNSIAHYGSAIGLIVLGFVNADPAMAVAILTISVALSSGTMIGYQVNYIDLSPNFAGAIISIGNAISNIMSIIGPLVVGFIVTDTSPVFFIMIQAVDAKERNDQTDEKERGTWLQARYLVAFSCSLINTVFYFMRINLSVAIVAIALETEEHDVTDVKYSAPAGLMASVHQLLSRWAPPEERSRMVVYAYCVEDTPAKHRLASPHEKNLIEMSLASSIEQQQIRQRLKTPWKSILTSLPYLSLLITQCCQAWGIWTLLTGIPSYLNGVFGFDLTQVILCSYGSALMLVILSFVSSNPTIAMIILVIAVACNAGCLIGSSVNHLDLSPNFAASLMGVANTAACMMAIISPLLVGFVVTDNENADQWRIIFLITAGLYVLGNTLFLIFGTTNEQPWNNPDWKSTDVERGTWLQARYVVALACSILNAIFYLMRVNLSVAIVAIALETDESAVTDVKHNAPAGLMASVHQLLARWAPPEERSRMVVYAYCDGNLLPYRYKCLGQQIGIILALAGSGVVCEWIGWPYVFYISGILGLVLAPIWMWLVADSPAKHRLASPQERNLIETSLASCIEQQQLRQRLKTPWKAILTSLPFLSLLFSYCCQAWGFWTLLTGIPSYMNGVFGFNLAQDGLLSSLPYLAMWVTSLVFGWGADELLKRGVWSVEVSRKLGNSIGLYGSALMLVILSFVSSNPTTAVIILVIAVACNAGCLVGCSANYLDLSPNFASSLVGIANAAACIMCIIGPLLVGFVVTDNENADQWRIIFLITAGLYVLGNTLFLIFGTANEQPWNNPDWNTSDAGKILKLNLLSTNGLRETVTCCPTDIKRGKGTWLQARYVVAFTCTLLNAIFFLMRINLSMTIVAIALDTEETKNATSTTHNAPHYDWDAVQRSTVMSGFFWGNTVMQLPYMFFIQRVGPKRAGLIMTFFSTLFTILFVPAAALGWQCAFVSRVFLGFSQSGLWICVHSLLARWAPPIERSRMFVYSYCGQQLGTIFALASSGVLSEWLGWPKVFYMNGALGFVVLIIWWWLIEDSPSYHRLASPRERKLIDDSLAATIQEQELKKHLKTPWRAILTSIPFLAAVVSFCAQGWGYWTLLTGIPSYMRGVLNFDLTQDGLLSSLPYVAMWIMSLVLGWGSDELLKRGVWSVDISRKLANSIGLYGPATMLVVLSFVEPHPTTVVAILIVAVGLNAGCIVGHTPTTLDLSPNFVSNLLAVGNTIACSMAIFGPLLTGFIVTENDNADQWRIVFLIAAGFNFVGNTVFVVFGSAQKQVKEMKLQN